MIQIRKGVFETNSSSTHSLTVCTKEEWDQFVKGEVVLLYRDGFVPADKKDEMDGESYDAWKDDDSLEIYVRNHTTKSGDEIVIFGKYGYDG